MREKTSAGKRALTALCFAMFLLYAMYFNGFGTNAQNTMAFFNITESQNGLIMTIQAIGCIIVTILLGLFGERINKIYGVMTGMLVMGAAGIMIGLLPQFCPNGEGYGLMLGFSLVAGLGYIAVDLLMNGVVADVFPEKKTTILPIVHAFYGGGAMLAPLFVTALIDPDIPDTFALPYLILGAASAVVGVVVFFVAKKVTPETPYADRQALKRAGAQNPVEVFKSGKAWLFLLACFFYLCFQTGISTWLPKYSTDHLGMEYGNAALMVTLYFLGALVMRLLSPLVYKRISVRNFYIITLLLSAAVFLVFLFVPMQSGLRFALMVIMGLLQGSSVPGLVLMCCDAFPTRSASASSIVVLGVSLAALTAPVALGRLIESTGYFNAMLLLTVCIPLSVLALLPVNRLGKKDS